MQSEPPREPAGFWRILAVLLLYPFAPLLDGQYKLRGSPKVMVKMDEGGPVNSQPMPQPDAGSRILGMFVGGGAGAFMLVVMSASGWNPMELMGLPGGVMAVFTGMLSRGRDLRWGALAGLLGILLTVFVFWLRQPLGIGFGELAKDLASSPLGIINFAAVLGAGLLLGSGWKKTPREAGTQGQLEDSSISELLEAWEDPMSDLARDSLKAELMARGYRVSSLPTPPAQP